MRSFGVAYQGGALFRALTLGENVALPLQERGGLSAAEIERVVKEKLAMVNLDGFEDYMPADLSGGMVKRAAFARAMALDPKTLFFDEPSAGLDPISSAQLDRLILDIRRRTGATIMLVTHELPSIFAVADRVIVLDRKAKGVVADGDPKSSRILSRPGVRPF
jgi:phospholipid/cholesterol/gamma-HCH transport system ATP-binding protein